MSSLIIRPRSVLTLLRGLDMDWNFSCLPLLAHTFYSTFVDKR